MTLANAFKVHRMALDRWMDSNGRIHHGTRPATGVAMPIANHTFHDGEEPVDLPVTDKWWLVPGAMDAERDAMRTWCPTFTEVPGTDDTPPAWIGSISTPKTTFKVAIKHRHDHGLPFVIPEPDDPRLRAKSPHRYISGLLCVADEADWNSVEHTAATVVGWTAHWYDAFVDWIFFHVWPIETHVSSAA
jgi:hypothetical protein